MCVPAMAQTSTSGRQFTQSEHLMHHIIAAHFGLTHEQVMDLHARGYSYEDIATAANISARSGRPLADVVAMRDRRMEWPAIASQTGVAEMDYQRPFHRVAGARAEMTTSGRASFLPERPPIDWNRSYELTPLEMKRLRAMGLSDREIWVAANAARMTGRDVDEFVHRIFRGQTVEQIAEEYNLSASLLRKPLPLWETPEWQQAVRDGRLFAPSVSGMTAGTMQERR